MGKLAVCIVIVLSGGGVCALLCRLAWQRISEHVVADSAVASQTSLQGRKRMVILAGIYLLLAGAITGVRMGVYQDDLLNIINLLLIFSVLLPCAWTDLRAKLIPNSVLLWGAVLRCGVLIFWMLQYPEEFPGELIRSVIAAVALCAVALICRLLSPGSIGFGDVKLLALMGFSLGIEWAWGCVMFTMLASFFFSLFALITRRANMKTELPYAPFVLLGTVAATLLLTA